MKTIQDALNEAFATWDGIRRFMPEPATHTAMGDLDDAAAEALEMSPMEMRDWRDDNDRLRYRG